MVGAGSAGFARQLMTEYELRLDPLTAAVCSLEDIDRLFEEMWDSERESLTTFG